MLIFPTQPARTLPELEQKLFKLVPQLELWMVEDMEVGITSTAIAHGLPATPRFVFPVSQSLTPVCKAGPPDSKHIYLRAAAPCVCDVWVAL